MSASLTVDCSTEKYQGIQGLAIASMLLVPTSILAIFYFMLLPTVPYIEARTERSGVSPVVDFLIGDATKTTHHHFHHMSKRSTIPNHLNYLS